MKFTSVSALALAGLAVATDDMNPAAETTSSKMQVLMNMKLTHREQQRAAGVFDENKYASSGPVACSNGKAGEYACGNVDLMAFLSHQDMGSSTREGNDVWGKLLHRP
jgi:hypothetical protein